MVPQRFYQFKILLVRGFLSFIFFSICGWLCEVLFELMFTHRLVNRGFLYGPYLPIYGTGIIVLTILLNRYPAIDKSPGKPLRTVAVIFLVTGLTATAIEYLTSFLMEALFHRTWWDYSGYACDLHGRVCLMTSLLFGAGGVLSYYILIPAANKILKLIPEALQNWFTISFLILVGADYFVTFFSILK